MAARWWPKPVVAVAVLCVVVAAGSVVLALQVPPYDTLGAAIADLGPVAGWRCAEAHAYAYDPRQSRPDANLLAEAPDAAVRAAAPEAEIQRIEVDLGSGEAVAWTEVPTGAQRVFVLAPGRLRAVSLVRDGSLLQICDSHLGDWQIVGDHALG